MTTPEIRQKFLEILDSVIGCEQDTVQDESDLIRDLGADSLDVVEITLECELEFAIDIPDEDAEKLKTVKQWVDYLEAQIACISLDALQAALKNSPNNPFLKGHVAALEAQIR